MGPNAMGVNGCQWVTDAYLLGLLEHSIVYLLINQHPIVSFLLDRDLTGSHLHTLRPLYDS